MYTNTQSELCAKTSEQRKFEKSTRDRSERGLHGNRTKAVFPDVIVDDLSVKNTKVSDY